MLREEQVNALTFGLFPYIPLAINLTSYVLCIADHSLTLNSVKQV